MKTKQKLNKKFPKSFKVRILLKNEQMDLLEKFVLNIRDLAKWKARAKPTERNGYDWEFFLTLDKENKNENKTKTKQK